MKTGRSLTDLAAELQRQAESRKDYIADQGALSTRVVEGEIVLDGINGEPKPLTPFAYRQVADHLGIPAKYADRMRTDEPQLLAANINAWLKHDATDKRMVRTLDGRVRAFLSSKFRPLDNFDLAEAVLPVLLERKVQISSCELTETRMYIKGILPDLSEPLPDGLQYGVGHENVRLGERGRIVAAVVISNSDVGAGTLRIEPSTFMTWCTNLAIMKAAAMKKYHVGRAFSADEDFSVYRDETRRADDKAFWLKVRDVTVSAFNPDVFKAAIEQLKAAGKQPIVSEALPTVVEVAVKRLALPVGTGGGILTALAKGGDLSQLGLANAITYVANTTEDYEGATQLERAGGEVLALPPADWKAIAEAA